MFKRIISLILVLVLLFTGPMYVFAGQTSADSLTKTYDNAKKEYLKAKQVYLTAVKDWKNSVGEFDRIKEIEWTPENVEKLKKVLISASNVGILQLEHLSQYIENSDYENKEEAVQRIEEKQGELEKLKTTVEKAETKKELIAAALKIRSEGIKYKAIVKAYTGNVLVDRITKAHELIENTIEKLDNYLAVKEAEGIDVGDEKEELEDIKSDLDKLEMKYHTAYEQFNKINDATDSFQLFKEGHGIILELNQELKLIFTRIKEVAQEINNL